jgi:hypothetical protein
MAPRKAQSVSIEALARSVDSAVKLAAARHDLVVDQGTIIDRWEIIGRKLRSVKDMNVAYAFAAEVTSAVKIPGLKLDPIASRIRRDILVGFIERGRLPKVISR